MHTINNSACSFGLNNDAYKVFRISYPPVLFDLIEKAVPQMRHKLAVDLGSGTGLSLTPLLNRFDHVIAVEPDARMAEKIAPHNKLDIRVQRSEEFDVESDSVDLITCATAFYWMDGPSVIEHMARWLHPEGLIAVYRYGFPVLPESIGQIIHRELRQHWNVFRSSRLIDEEYSWRCFSESSHLRQIDRQIIPNTFSMNSHQLAGFFSSTSYCSAYMRSIEDADTYLKSLQQEITVAANDQSFDVDFTLELITATI